MKGHWIPPAPRGFIDRIAAKLGYSKTIPTGLGSDVVEAVGTLNDQIGDVALPTTAQTLTGAIAENYTAIANILTFKVLYNGNRVELTQGTDITVPNIQDYDLLVYIYQTGQSGNYFEKFVFTTYMSWPMLMCNEPTRWADVRVSTNNVHVQAVGSGNALWLYRILGLKVKYAS